MSDPAIQHVYRAIEDARASGERLPVEQIRTWMTSASPDIRALAFAILFDYPNLVESPEPDEVESFFRGHLLEAIAENHPTTNFPSRYMAAHTLRAWFQRMWAVDRNNRMVVQLKNDLASLIRGGDAGIRDAVITGILEHLFTSDAISDFFADWVGIPELAGAYNEAMRLRARP